jgi:NAD(P)-dependent dehydrogenase (short-subunit alcohol dehydrogenase family)
MSELRFDGRVAVITGAGRGLGRAHALLLASRGARVIVNDPGVSRTGDGIDAGPAEAVVAEIRAAGGQAFVSIASVSTPEGGQAIIDAALNHFGRIDILVHNAGISRRVPFREATQDDFDAVLDVHLRGAFHVARPAFPLMCDAGYGRIVLTGSIAGLYGERNVTGYCVGKAGLIGLANILALEGSAEGVTCNLIIPAAVTRLAEGRDTSGFPPMEPDLVAPAVAWLCHEDCTMSGEMLISLAGRLAKAFVAETPGVYRPAWTIDDVAGEMAAIGNATETLRFPILPQGFYDHLQYSFEMARKGAPAGT